MSSFKAKSKVSLLVVFFACLLLFIVWSQKAQGHSSAGLSFDQTDGNYILDLDAETEKLTARESIRFNFALWNQDRSKKIEADNFWVRITPKDSQKTMFAGLIGTTELGSAGISYVFPDPSDYNFYLRAQKHASSGDESLAEATFPLTLTAGEAENLGGQKKPALPQNFIWLIFGVLAGLSLGLFVKSKGSLTKKNLIWIVTAIVLILFMAWFVTKLVYKSPSASVEPDVKEADLDLISPPPMPSPPSD